MCKYVYIYICIIIQCLQKHRRKQAMYCMVEDVVSVQYQNCVNNLFQSNMILYDLI